MSVIGSNLRESNSSPLKTKQICVIVGHSIYAITTATVLVSLGHIVSVYADPERLEHTLTNYTFEHQQQALWQLYISQNTLTVNPMPEDATTLFHDHTEQSELFWFFYPELPKEWLVQRDELPEWVAKLNQSQVGTQIPLILSGIAELGVFDSIAQQSKRPWVYYVPFVFMQDGRSYDSMLSPMVWLMGEKTPNSLDKIQTIQPLLLQAKKSFVTDIKTVEFSRSAIMSMLATRVSFMNEWSRLADYQGVDITEVSTIMGLDPRIGKSYLKAGWGFGGHTLPTELSALIDTLKNTQVEHRLIETVQDINDDQKELIFRKFWQYFDGMIEGKSVSIWGAGYRSGSGRTSASAIHPLLRLLWSYHITTYVYAAEAQIELVGLYPDQPLLKFVNEPTEKLNEVDALFVIVWSNTHHLPIAAINHVALPVFDAQNAFTKEEINTLAGSYRGIGRGK